jgi:hypothetical protein
LHPSLSIVLTSLTCGWFHRSLESYGTSVSLLCWGAWDLNISLAVSLLFLRMPAG